MLRKALGLVVVVCVGSVLAAQTKDKDKDVKAKDKDKDGGVKATLVKADVDRKMLVVTLEGGKRMEYEVTKDVKFVGPRGGVSKEGLKDDRLTAGAELVLKADGKTLREVQLPFRGKKGADDKKDKKDDKKDVKDKKDAKDRKDK